MGRTQRTQWLERTSERAGDQLAVPSRFYARPCSGPLRKQGHGPSKEEDAQFCFLSLTLSLSCSATFKKMSPGSRDASSSLSVSTAISEPGVAERVGAFESRGSSSLYLSVVAAEDMKQVVHEGLFSLSPLLHRGSALTIHSSGLAFTRPLAAFVVVVMWFRRGSECGSTWSLS